MNRIPAMSLASGGRIRRRRGHRAGANARRPRPRRRRPSTRSPATSASSANTSSAASRRPPASRRCRAASTSRTRAASTPARGRRTSAGSQDFGAYSRSSLEWDFYGGFKANFADSDFVLRRRHDLLLLPGQAQSGRASTPTPGRSTPRSAGSGSSVKFSYSLDDYFGARPTGQKTDGTYYIDLYGHLSGRRDRLRADRPRRLSRRRQRRQRRRPRHRRQGRATPTGRSASSYTMSGRPGEGPRARRVLHGQRREDRASTPTCTGYDTVEGPRRRLRQEDVLTRPRKEPP